MTEATTKVATTLTEQIDTRRDESGETIPVPQPLVAEIMVPAPGEALLPLSLTLKEIGAVSASILTGVKSGWIRDPSALNIVNSVLRKCHDAKALYVKEHL